MASFLNRLVGGIENVFRGGPQPAQKPQQPQQQRGPMIDPRALQAAFNMGQQRQQGPAPGPSFQSIHNLSLPAPPPHFNLAPPNAPDPLGHFLQSIPRGVIQLGQSLQPTNNATAAPHVNLGPRIGIQNLGPKPVAPTMHPTQVNTFTPQGHLHQMLLGSQPIQPLQSTYSAARAAGHGVPFALGLTGAEAAGDIPILGSGKGTIIKDLAGATKVGDVTNILNKAKVAPEVTKVVAPAIAKTSKPAEIQSILKAGHDTLGIAPPPRIAKVITSQVGKNVNKPNVPEFNPHQQIRNDLSSLKNDVEQHGATMNVPAMAKDWNQYHGNPLKPSKIQAAIKDVTSPTQGVKVPVPTNAGLSKTELTAGRALGMSKKDILAAKNENSLPVAMAHTVDQIQRGQHFGISNMAELSPKEQTAVTNVLKNIPAPSRAMPKVPVGVGDLPPVQELPGIKKMFLNKVNALKAINTPSSNELANRIQNIEGDSTNMRANWMSQMPTVQKLGNKDFQRAWDIQEGAKTLPTDKATVVKAAGELKNVMADIHQMAFGEGVVRGEKQNYMPRQYPDNFFTKTKGTAYDNAIQHLMDTKQLDYKQATQLFQDTANQFKGAKRFGHFEYSRLTDMPGYTKSKDVLNHYIEGSANAIAQARQFGNDGEIAKALLDRVRVEGGDHEAATQAINNYLRSPEGNSTTAKALRGVRGFFGAARLGTAAISHAPQTSNVAVDAGVTKALKGWGQFLSRNAEHRDFIAKTGVTNPQVLHNYQDQYTSVKGLMSKATAPGLNTVMKVNRSVAALAYREYGNALAKKGAEGELRKLGVAGDIGRKLTPEQEIQVARGGVDRTMFNPSRATTPIGAETKTGKLFGQYRLAYGYKQAGFIYDRILKEAKNGNLAPLARYLALSAPLTAGAYEVKGKIANRKEGIGGIGLDTAAALGGIPGELLVNGVRYGKKDIVGTAAGDIAPVAGEAVKLGNAVQSAIKGKYAAHDFKPLEGYAAGLAGPVGGFLKSKVYGNKTSTPTGDQTNPSKSTMVQDGMSGAFVMVNGKKTAWNSLKEADKKSLAQSDPQAKQFYEVESKMKKALTPAGIYPDGVSAESAHILDRNARLSAKGKEAVNTNEPDWEYRLKVAQYELDKASGKLSPVQDQKAQDALAKEEVGSRFPYDVRNLYSESKAKIYNYITTNPDGNKLADQLAAYDQALKDAGITTTLKFKNGFAPKIATSTGRSKGSRSGIRGSGGSSGGTVKVAKIRYRLPPKPKALKIGKLPATPKAPKRVKFATPKLAKMRVKKVKLQ